MRIGTAPAPKLSTKAWINEPSDDDVPTSSPDEEDAA
ncbi:hypothetical protein HNP84_003965 [Thermocatellispora tengchongensis]|uniref:Uncharacterized protein n=1 Tax=Thermocatellispora tengchongensis TaxID=1073253 RepID=A0A840P5G0_9ACTN|nr:hypothetical protein [Thermocatellispora tengchongensis]